MPISPTLTSRQTSALPSGHLSDLFIGLPAKSITPLPAAYLLFALIDVIVPSGDYRYISTKDDTDINQLPKFPSGPPTRCVARESEQKEQGERKDRNQILDADQPHGE